jgi:type II secretory pathway pseudopilin PulG
MRRIKTQCGLRIAECRLMRGKIRNPKSEIRNASGFTYVALLAVIVILGISMGAAGKYWSFVIQRDKEEELLFRGEQYRLAIERYYRALPGKSVYPASIEELMKDSRTPAGKRYLRQAYKDPMTGEDFEVYKDMTKGNRITGVFSKSEKEPLKKTGFPEQYRDFENKWAYNDWKFIFTAPITSPTATGQTDAERRRSRNRPMSTPTPAQ